jgi:hypothetical protein
MLSACDGSSTDSAPSGGADGGADVDGGGGGADVDGGGEGGEGGGGADVDGGGDVDGSSATDAGALDAGGADASGCGDCEADCGPCTEYFDDTHLSIDDYTAVEDLSAHEPVYVTYTWDAHSDTALDCRGGAFVVANSKNDTGADCDVGTLPINKYPLDVKTKDSIAVVGGIIYSDIPLQTDWQLAYCNSAAVLVRESHSSIVDGMRITGAWDAIRPAWDAPGFVVVNNWVSNVRDDFVENDEYQPMEIRDNLVDGTFQGISIRNDEKSGDFSNVTVKVSANVIRIQSFLYKGNHKFGAIFKRASDLQPTTTVYNTVVAVDSSTDSTFEDAWRHTWSGITDCDNNELLWLSDSALPSAMRLDLMPACFTVHQGQTARDRWQAAKTNWIDCHPRLQRLDTDPVSTPANCVPNQFGGFGN